MRALALILYTDFENLREHFFTKFNKISIG